MALDPRIPMMAQAADMPGSVFGGFQQGYGLADLGRQRLEKAQAAAQERDYANQRLSMERDRLSLQKQQFSAEQEATQRANAGAAFGLIARVANASKTPEEFAMGVDALGENGIIKPEVAQKYRNAFDQRAAISAWADTQAKTDPASYREYQLAQRDPEYGKFLERQRQEAQADRLALVDARMAGKGLGSGEFGASTQGKVLAVLSEGNTSSPEYAAAYWHASQPKSMIDPATGQVVTIQPNMSAFKPPTAPAAGQPANAAGDAGSDANAGTAPQPAREMNVAPSIDRVGNVQPGSKVAEAGREQIERDKQKAELKAAMERQIRTAETLLNHPGRETATGASSFMAAVPGSSARGFAAELEAFDAQSFLPMVQALRGMGALSNAEGDRLTKAIGNLQRNIPEKEFQKNLETIIGDLRASYARSFGAPQTAGAPPSTQGANNPDPLGIR